MGKSAHPIRGLAVSLIGAGAMMSALSLGVSVTTAAAAECKNQDRRTEQESTFLPRCRAYELVSPEGAAPFAGPVGTRSGGASHGAQAATAGGGIGWYTVYPPPGPQTGNQYYLSRRGDHGWSTVSAVPTQSAGAQQYKQCQPSVFFSPNLSTAVVSDGYESIGVEHGIEAYCGHNEPALVEDEPEGFQNIFLRDSDTASYSLVNLTPEGAPPRSAFFEGASTMPGEEFSHVVFEEAAQLTSGAPDSETHGAGEVSTPLYEWSHGVVHLVSVLPGGEGVVGTLPHGVTLEVFRTEYEESKVAASQFTHAVSADGSRVYFTANGKLFLRVNADKAASALEGEECVAQTALACTVQIDKSQVGGAGGGGNFLWASSDGGRVFFTDTPEAELTEDTTAESGANLYMYEVGSGKLTDLTPVVAGKEAGVQGVSGVSEDGSYVYFVADGALAAGATSGQCAGSDFTAEEKSEGAIHTCSLYVWHSGAGLEYVAPVETAPKGAEGRPHDWGSTTIELTLLSARVSPNGEYLAFNSVRPLTSFDNSDRVTGEPDREIYLYDAAKGEVRCVSCGASAPTGPSELSQPENTQVQLGPVYMNRNVLDSGQVFFDTPNALVESDRNRASDVYEYDEGAVRLISTGLSPVGSFFVDASANGQDVFFTSAENLVGWATGSAWKLYDAREGGGFPEPPAAGQECEDEGCHGGPASVTPFASPSSALFSGAGNVPPAAAKPKAAGGERGRAKAKARKRKLQRALRACTRRYRHSADRRRRCRRRARTRYRASAKGARRRGGHDAGNRRHRRQAGGAR